jgi:UDP-glucose 4-epimerase
VKWGPLVIGDIGDGDRLRDALECHSIDAVVHFAADAYVGESMRDPRKYFHNNVVGTLSLLDAMIECDVRNLVFSSSCATYGVPGSSAPAPQSSGKDACPATNRPGGSWSPSSLRISESTLQTPINPYGDSKLFCEKMTRWYGQAYGLKWVALRYFNACGADPDGEIGEDHDPETHLIPLVLAAAQAAIGKPTSAEQRATNDEGPRSSLLAPHSPLKVFGTDYPTPDGTCIRDYIHVADLADAHIRALQYVVEGGEPMALNLGTGRGHSVKEVIAMARKVTGIDIPAEEHPRRPGDPPELVAEASLAEDVLGWTPQHSDLETIITTAWSWHKEGAHGRH